MNEPLTQERTTHEPKRETTAKPNGQAFSGKPLSQETLSQETLASDTLSDLFQDRDQDRDQRLVLESNPATTPKAQGGKSLQEEEEEKSDKIFKTADDTKREDAPLELQRLQQELEKTQKRLTENQQYGRQNAQRLKTALKVVKELETEGSLSEEEAARLIESLERESDGDVGMEVSHPFGKVLAIANQELENIRKYTDDATLDDKVRAFDYFLLVASPEEQEEALEDLTALKGNPLSVAKKMLSIGQQHEKAYQEMKDVGSLQGLLDKKAQDIDTLRKTLDKLRKKLAQYEDYDKPRYRLDEMNELEESTSQDSISSLFDDRDRVRRR